MTLPPPRLGGVRGLDPLAGDARRETMADMGRRLADAVATRRRRELTGQAIVRSTMSGRSTLLIDARRTATALRDVQVQMQYGFALGTDLAHMGIAAAQQFLVDVGLIYHQAPRPEDPNSVDPGGREMHMQLQVNSDLVNRGRVTVQGNLQGTLAATIVGGAWGNIQASLFGQLSAGSAYDSGNRLGPLFGLSGGVQIAGQMNLGDHAAVVVALQGGGGVQSADSEVQLPAQGVATVTLILDPHEVPRMSRDLIGILR
jgi:hypothetical protein